MNSYDSHRETEQRSQVGRDRRPDIAVNTNPWVYNIEKNIKRGKIEKILGSIFEKMDETSLEDDNDLWLQLSAEWYLLKDDKLKGAIKHHEYMEARKELLRRIIANWKSLKESYNYS